MTIVDAKNTEFKEQITSLWNKSFGDPKSFVEDFFTAFDDEVTCCLLFDETKTKVLSMANLISCKLKINSNEFNIVYLYAMCTDEQSRGQGNGLKLLKEIEDYCRDKGLDGIALLPAEDGLVSFYEKAGYRSFFVNEPVNDNAIIYTDKYLAYINQIGVSSKQNLPNGMLLPFNSAIDLSSKPYMAYPMN